MHCAAFVSVLLLVCATAAAEDNLSQLDWLKGRWFSQYSGRSSWPTMPTINYVEEVVIEEAPVAKAAGVQMLKFSARSWSPSALDHTHDEWGYLAVNDTGYAALMTTGNNGFNKYETGFVYRNRLSLELEDIFRIEHVRDLPVLNLKRRFTFHPSDYLEQNLEMTTKTHPWESHRTLPHANIFYQRVTNEL